MDPNKNEGQDQTIQEKVVINGVEYDASEASDLIGLGSKTRELETKWNTKLDKVWPEYGQTREQLKKTQSELDQARAQLNQFQVKKDAGTENAADVEKAREAARKLGLVLSDDLDKTGYIKKDDLDSYLSQREQERNAVTAVLSEADSLEKEIDGSDGRPKFKKKQVLAYASAYGISDLKQAYEDMNSDELKSWKEGQISAHKSPGLKTIKTGSGQKTPVEPKITDSNFNDALKEALWGNKS